MLSCQDTLPSIEQKNVLIYMATFTYVIHILMYFTVSECRRRWKLLRDAFVRNKKQNNNNLPSGSAGGTVKEWKYDRVMSFLLPYMQPRKLV